MNRRALLLSAFVVLGGCATDVAAPVASAPTPESIATLMVSGSTRERNALLTFTARLNANGVAKRAGAYSVHVEYDPSVVTYVGAGEATSGLVAFHAEGGVLKVAGASLDGYEGGVLFNAVFRVTRPSPTAEVRLVLDELRDVSATDRLSGPVAARTALLRPWR